MGPTRFPPIAVLVAPFEGRPRSNVPATTAVGQFLPLSQVA